MSGCRAEQRGDQKGMWAQALQISFFFYFKCIIYELIPNVLSVENRGERQGSCTGILDGRKTES